MTQDNGVKAGVVDVSALYLGEDGSTSEAALCQVVEEDALTLDVESVGHYTLMWTPTTPDNTAQGYTVADGMLGDEERPEGLCLALGFCLLRRPDRRTFGYKKHSRLPQGAGRGATATTEP